MRRSAHIDEDTIGAVEAAHNPEFEDTLLNSTH